MKLQYITLLQGTRIWYLNHNDGCIYTAWCLCVLASGNKWLGLPDLLAVTATHSAPCVDLAREQQIWGTRSSAPVLRMQNCSEVLRSLYLWKQDVQIKENSCLTTKRIARERWDFFPWYGLKNILVYRLSTENIVDITGTSPVWARGVRSGALRQMVCVSAYLCAHRLLCVNAVRKEEEEEEEGTVLAGGRKSNEKFSQVAQETVNLLQSRRLLKLTGLKARLEKMDI